MGGKGTCNSRSAVLPASVLEVGLVGGKRRPKEGCAFCVACRINTNLLHPDDVVVDGSWVLH